MRPRRSPRDSTATGSLATALPCSESKSTFSYVSSTWQVATQVIGWLHEEAAGAGIKCGVEFLSLCVELGQVGRIRLAAHLDPDDQMGCISWRLVTADGDSPGAASDDVITHPEENKILTKHLGHLSLESLYSILMDLARISSRLNGGS